MNIKPIKSNQDYQEALKRLEEIFDAPEESPESDEANMIALLVDEYEKENHPLETPDPIEAIKIRMEEMNLSQKDLIPEIGGRSRVSEVLNKKRPLTVGMIRRLSENLDLPANILIQDYTLNGTLKKKRMKDGKYV